MGAILIFAAVLALIPALIAARKVPQRQTSVFLTMYVLGFFLWIIALPYAIWDVKDERPAYQARFQQCPHCREQISRDASVCPHCQLAVSDAVEQPSASLPRLPPKTRSASESDDVVAHLKELVELHERGALTDEEFASAKGRLLG